MEIFQIFIMRSKSEAGTALDRITWDYGLANEIFMDNAPEKNCYNTEIQRVEGLARMDVCTTNSHYPWKNKAEIVIKIIKGKSNRRRVQRNIPKRVWGVGIVWEADIYYRTAGKDGHPDLKRSTGDTTETY